MDWTKAKNILIFAFIATNLFLLYNVERGLLSEKRASAVSDGQVADVIELLAERGVSVISEIPKDISEVSSLEVTYVVYEAGKTAEVFFESPVNLGEGVFVQDGETLRILDEKRLVYEKELFGEGSEPDLDSSKGMATKFLKEKGFGTDNMIFSASSSEDGLKSLVYLQEAEGLPLENGRMEFLVSGNGVVRFERSWFEVLNVGESSRKVIPATKALLMADEILEGKTDPEISEIILIYLFDTKKDSLSKWQDVKSGTALPVWKITLTGETNPIYVDAYKGIIVGN